MQSQCVYWLKGQKCPKSHQQIGDSEGMKSKIKMKHIRGMGQTWKN